MKTGMTGNKITYNKENRMNNFFLAFLILKIYDSYNNLNIFKMTVICLFDRKITSDSV